MNSLRGKFDDFNFSRFGFTVLDRQTDRQTDAITYTAKRLSAFLTQVIMQ